MRTISDEGLVGVRIEGKDTETRVFRLMRSRRGNRADEKFTLQVEPPEDTRTAAQVNQDAVYAFVDAQPAPVSAKEIVANMMGMMKSSTTRSALMNLVRAGRVRVVANPAKPGKPGTPTYESTRKPAATTPGLPPDGAGRRAPAAPDGDV
jgi:hypothetical protein